MAAAYFTGNLLGVVGKPGDIDTSQRNPLGTRMPGVDSAGGYAEWVYLAGAAAVAANDAVTYNTTAYVAIRSLNDAVGFVAIATAAILAANWGWFQVYGFGSVNVKTSIAGANGAFLTTTAGALDDASVAGDFVNGLVFTGVDVALVAPCHFSYPYVTNTVPA